MSNTYTTYNKARAAVLDLLNIDGKARLTDGVIVLKAEFNGRMVNVTENRSQMAERVRTYKAMGKPYHFEINEGLIVR